MPAAHELITGFFFYWGSFSGNKNPPGGLPDPNPGFSETQIPVFIFLDFFSKKYVGAISKNK